MNFKSIFLVFLLSIFNVQAVSYRNAKVVEIKIQDENQLEKVKQLELVDGFRFWDSPYQVGTAIELIIQPEKFAEFQKFGVENGILYEILTDDVQSWFDTEKPQNPSKKADDLLKFDEFKTSDEINEFIIQMNAAHPEVTELFTIGNSFEGRPINGIKITTNESNPVMFIDANIHAREWISSATAVWVINELLTTEDEAARKIIDSMTWIVIPLLNPDGYIYTHNVDRLWRKTRSTHASLLCAGADPNRNFGYNFMKGGSSQIACSDTFAGREAYSEAEPRALNEFYGKMHEKVKIYLTFHSAAEMILYPMGHTSTFDEVPNVDDLDAIAIATITAVRKRHGTVYKWGSSFLTLSMSSGTSKDHMYGHYKTPISYTYEFRAAKNGNRFILPVEEIIPNSEEAFDGILAMIEKSKELGYF